MQENLQRVGTYQNFDSIIYDDKKKEETYLLFPMEINYFS